MFIFWAYFDLSIFQLQKTNKRGHELSNNITCIRCQGKNILNDQMIIFSTKQTFSTKELLRNVLQFELLKQQTG